MPDYGVTESTELEDEAKEQYGVTENGFVLKRMDTIINEVHDDLTYGFGVDTRLDDTSFLNVLVTTFCGQIASLWETAQDSYYAKYPFTAEGINLDNAVTFGGIRRNAAKRSAYPLYCTGTDGTEVPSGTQVGTTTEPQVVLYNESDFVIGRASCNRIVIRCAVAGSGSYWITINGTYYSYTSASSNPETILTGLAAAITSEEWTKTISTNAEGQKILTLQDVDNARNNAITLSDTLTTTEVTTIETFVTMEYGRITIPDGLVTVLIDSVTGFTAVNNGLTPTLGNDDESDIELRNDYRKKNGINSNRMISSIVAAILNEVDNVESCCGYENNTNSTDEYGLPPHSIEIIVDGGDTRKIAEVILEKKAGGIQTYGSTTVDVPDNYGRTIPISFNRPSYQYVWLKIELTADTSMLPANYVALVKEGCLEYGETLESGDSLLIQPMDDHIYERVAGITYVNSYTAVGVDATTEPDDEDYAISNVSATMRQKILLSEARIEVSVVDSGNS